MPEGNEPVTPPMPPGTPGNLQPPATPVYPTFTAPGAIQWRQAMLPAALAGLLAGLFIFLPYLSALIFIWMFIAGLIAVMAYRKRVGASLTLFMGARIGAVVGFFAFLVVGPSFLISALSEPDKLREALQQSMQNSARNADPQQTKALQDLLARMSTPEGLHILMILALLLLFGFLVVLCAVGGAAGSTIGGKNRPV